MQGKLLSNRYLLAEEIGNGGMGSVFRAQDLRTGGQVAVKIPHPFLARDPIYTQRLRNEARIASKLDSPRIVRVVDFDTDDGLPFLVMEFVSGETLADEMHSRGRLSISEALTVALEIARALDAAYQRGIVHRDLKPQNIKLVEGQIKVLDFGIAREEGMAGVTAVQVFMGTPEYAAPERAEGLADIRSDIYSLGVLLYEMLAGHLPFTGLSPIAVLRKHEREQPPPLPGDIPEEPAAIVLRCLAKPPEERYATPRELAGALTTALRSLPLPTPVPGTVPLITDGAPLLSVPGTRPPPASPIPLPTAVLDLDDEPPAGWRPGETLVRPGSDTAPMSAVPVTLPDPAHRPPGTRPLTITLPVLRTLQTVVNTPRRRALLAGTSLAAAISLGLIGWLIVSDSAGTWTEADAPIVGALNPSTATAAAIIATPVSAAPVIPAVTPVRPMRVAELPLEGAASTEERNLIRTLNEANRAEVLAFRRADTTGLDAYFTGPALREATTVIGALKRLGRYGVSDLKEIALVTLTMDTLDRATMETREVQDYDEMLAATNDPVPEKDLHRQDQVLRWTYRLVKQESRWLIESKNFSVE